MIDLPKVFLDTSLLIAVTITENPMSPGRGLFRLGVEELLDLRISPDVLREAEQVLIEEAGPDATKGRRWVARLAENLAASHVATTVSPNESTVQVCMRYTHYRPDAKILAAAIEADVDVVVAYDRQHLLNNPMIRPPNTRFVVMSGGEALEWAVDQIKTRAREQATAQKVLRRRS
ncbi:MAG: PIN domain-containing protein [Capsulimonadaceae bacterium]